MYGMQRRVDEMQGAGVAVLTHTLSGCACCFYSSAADFIHRKGLLACAAGCCPMRLEQQGRWQAGWC